MGTNHDAHTDAEIRANLGAHTPEERGTFRLVVCVDIDADTLADAYRELRRGMNAANFAEGWESSDEWFDRDGDTGEPEELQSARMEVMDPDKVGTLFACHVCGCTDVQSLDWVDANTGALAGGDPCGDNYCPQCETDGRDPNGIRFVDVHPDDAKPYRAEGS